MDLSGIGLFLIGLLLRLGIPIGVTLILVRWLSRLDARWQEDARRDAEVMASTSRARNTGCWDVRHCPPEQKTRCPAFAHKEIPCWQLFRQKNGTLREGCLGCRVFREAPVPVVS
jgi:hypothetical protein